VPLPKVAEDAAQLVDRYDVGAIAEAILRLLSDGDRAADLGLAPVDRRRSRGSSGVFLDRDRSRCYEVALGQSDRIRGKRVFTCSLG
jgi:hypothetical protein